MYADYENRYETALSIYTNFMKDQAFGNKVRVSKAKPFIYYIYLTPIHVTNGGAPFHRSWTSLSTYAWRPA